MPDKSKFEREIDEILKKTEGDPEVWSSNREGSRSSRSKKRRAYEPFSTTVPKSKQSKRGGSGAGGIKLDTGYLVVGGLVVLAVAAFTSFATLPLAIVGAAMLVLGYVVGFRKGSIGGFSGGGFSRGRTPDSGRKSEPEVKYWRGRRIDDKPEAPPEDRGGRGRIIDFGLPDDDDDDSVDK
ncbi:MAG TPA: hypothetical protein EYG09_07995 [Dehalococcoidia bacterium]|nr:hypothetical protein [Dehalococcoidia bacterium]